MFFKTKKILAISVALLLPMSQVLAQTLENIPGQTAVGSSDLTGYLNNLYKFGISITGILAIFMIGLGSFAYIVTSVGNSSKMMDAKETIQNALIGLTIALTAYLLLFVINPDLVKGTLQAPQTAINNIVGSTVPTVPVVTTLADGAQCGDDFGATGTNTCASCEPCSLCSSHVFYYVSSENKHYCGVDPAVTAGATAGTGCCIKTATLTMTCTTATTETPCEGDGGIWYSRATPVCSAASGNIAFPLTCN